jgi:hypothetical protein
MLFKKRGTRPVFPCVFQTTLVDSEGRKSLFSQFSFQLKISQIRLIERYSDWHLFNWHLFNLHFLEIFNHSRVLPASQKFYFIVSWYFYSFCDRLVLCCCHDWRTRAGDSATLVDE